MNLPICPHCGHRIPLRMVCACPAARTARLAKAAQRKATQLERRHGSLPTGLK